VAGAPAHAPAGLEGRCKKRWRKTTVPDPEAELARDLIQRHFGPCEEIDRRYVGDITYIATWEGWAYLATVIDLASRKVVGWALADHMRTELVEDALRWPLPTGSSGCLLRGKPRWMIGVWPRRLATPTVGCPAGTWCSWSRTGSVTLRTPMAPACWVFSNR
jgi:hypothetical protein